MRAFAFRAALFAMMQLGVFATLDALYRQRHLETGYLAAWGDKQRRLESLPRPRVLFAGGSNLAFGLDSRRLQRLLRRPVANLGLHAGLGRELILRQAEEAAAPGDLLVLSLEYNLVDDGAFLDPSLLIDLLALQPRARAWLAPQQWPALLDGGLTAAGKRPLALWKDLTGTNEVPSRFYQRDGFDEYGDVVAHITEQRPLYQVPWSVGPCGRPPGFEAGVERLARFAQRVRARGATPVLAPPSIPASDYDRARRRFDECWMRLTEGTGMPVVARETAALPDKLFFDTHYHLWRAGRRRRTEALARELLPLLPRMGAARGTTR